MFVDDGSLDITDLVAINDDDFSNGFGDGTIFGFDSYLSLNLAPGNYTIGIGQFPLSVAEAVAGQQTGKGYPLEFNGTAYIMTLIALLSTVGRATPPAALGKEEE